MSDHPPGEAFRVARRGYDRDEVDARLTELYARLEALEDDRNQLTAQLVAVGVESPADMRSELEAVAGDVGRVLEAAREAAEAMRSRAAQDAAQWRNAAEAASEEARRLAEQDAMALRGDAWRAGTELLQQATQRRERILAAAQQDAILTRAEAEQEAHRLTASARKDIADETRLAKLKAERMAEEARLAGEQLRTEAHREVQAAEQRVGSIEQRRVELMREIDAARAALAGLQEELDERRQALEPEPEPEPDSAPVAEPVPDRAPAEDSRPDWKAAWAADEVAIRIVSQPVPGPGEVVDAEAMAAEVRALRQAGAAEAPTGSPTPEPAPEPAAEASVEPEPGPVAVSERVVDVEPEPVVDAVPEPAAATEPAVDAEPGPVAVSERVVDVEPEPVVDAVPEPAAATEPAVDAEPEPVAVSERVVDVEPEPEPGTEPVAATEPAVDAEPEPAAVAEPAANSEPEPGTEPEPAAEPEPPLEAEPAPGGEGIDDLFSRLRGGGSATPAVVVASAPEPEPVPEPAPAPPRERPPLRAVPAAAGPDPFELRDRLLLPLTNKALRDAKRAIVDIQNVVLEELRTSGGEWSPEPGAFVAELGPTLAELSSASRSAGALAAAELSGADRPPDLAEPETQEGPDVSAALREGLTQVLGRSAEAGGGPRQQSATVSRFFRAWRTDEAERRLRHAAFAAFHRGLLDACAELGVPAVAGRADGRTCAACPASTGEPWRPRDEPPNGTAIPPAHDDCSCTVVPAP